MEEDGVPRIERLEAAPRFVEKRRRLRVALRANLVGSFPTTCGCGNSLHQRCTSLRRGDEGLLVLRPEHLLVDVVLGVVPLLIPLRDEEDHGEESQGTMWDGLLINATGMDLMRGARAAALRVHEALGFIPE